MILIFGGGGQLGRELARAAGNDGLGFVSLAHRDCDIADEKAVDDALDDYQPQLVINAAAYTKVDEAENSVAAARRGNETGPDVVARNCAAKQVPLIHISTDYVFDGEKKDPYSEFDPIAPISVYGRTKAAGEAAVRRALEHHVIVRTAWVYSEFGNNFLKTILRLAQEREELRIVADQHGCPTSARDLANALLAISPRLIKGDNVWGTYHFAGLGVTTWFAFAQRIVAMQEPFTGKRPNLCPIATSEYPTLAKRPRNSAFDCRHFISTFGFSPRQWTDEADAVVRALANSVTSKDSSIA